MKFTKLLAVTVTAGALLTGVGATTAFAADSTPAPSTARHRNFDCSKADAALAKLEAAKTKIPERVAKLEAAKTAATDAGRTKLAARIQHRIDRLNHALERIPNLETRIEQKCGTGGSGS